MAKQKDTYGSQAVKAKKQRVMSVFSDIEGKLKAVKKRHVKRGFTDKFRADLDKVIDSAEPSITDDFTFVDPQGNVYGKSGMMAPVKTGEAIFENHKRTNRIVHVRGDVAVYVSLVTMKGRFGGRDVSGQYRETHTLVKEKGKWAVMATQMTLVRPKSTGSKTGGN